MRFKYLLRQPPFAFALLAVRLIFSLYILAAVPSFAASTEMSSTEQQWIEDHSRIRLGYSAVCPPWLIPSENGEYSGLIADIVSELEQRIGIDIEIVVAERDQLKELVMSREIDGLLGIDPQQAASHKLQITTAFGEQLPSLFSASTGTGVSDLSEISGKRILVLDGKASIENLSRQLQSNNTLIPVSTAEIAVRAIDRGEADYFLGFSADTLHSIRQQLSHVRPVLIGIEDARPMAFGIRPDWPKMAVLFDRALEDIGDSRLRDMKNVWMGGAVRKRSQQEFLKAEDREILNRHKHLRLSFTKNSAPFVIETSDGHQSGILIDLRDELESLLDIKIDIVLEDDWPAVLKKTKALEYDGVSGFSTMGAHIINGTSTVPIFNIRHTIFSSLSNPFKPSSIADLSGYRVAFFETGIVRKLIESAEDRKLFTPVAHGIDGISSLAEGKVDYYLGVSADNFYISDMTLTGIGPIFIEKNNTMKTSIGLVGNAQELIPLFNRALTHIGRDGILAITRRWYSDIEVPRELLNSKEKAWLESLPPLKIAIARDATPFEWVGPDGEINGMTSDYMRIIAERLGLTIETVASIEKHDAYERLLAGELDMGFMFTSISIPANRPQSDPYMRIPMVITTRKDKSAISGLDDLSGKTIVVRTDSSSSRILKMHYPQHTVINTDNYEDAFTLIDRGIADALLTNSVMIDYSKRYIDFENYKIAASTEYYFEPVVTVNPKYARLVPLINRVLASFSDREKMLIFDRWANSPVPQSIIWKKYVLWLAIATSGLLLVMAFFAYTNRKLKLASNAKSAFLANMSHEIRTPMNAIIGFSELMQNNRSLDTEAQETLQIINSSGTHLLNLIDDILEFSKIEAGQISLDNSPFNLRAMMTSLQDIFRVSANAQSLQLNFIGLEELPVHIITDEGKLRQILMNLLGNSLKFTDQGSVTCESKVVENDGKSQLIITVRDTGAGIADEDKSKVFTSFEQTASGKASNGGTGLGLPISREYARLMGGEISFKSRFGVGSSFRLSVPIDISKDILPSLEHLKIIGLTDKSNPPKILVVDDKMENRLLLYNILHNMGFSVVEANDGLSAIRRYESERPDLILMDIRMPVMDGFEAIRKIRTLDDNRSIPIIAVTAHAFDVERKLVEKSGANDIVSKPFKQDELLQAIGQLLNLKYSYRQRELPQPARAKASTATQIDTSAVKNGRVLIVDDVAVNRLLLKKHLSNLGVDVREASGGVSALELIENWLPQIVFLDIQMPDMDGHEVMKRLPDLNLNSKPTIIVTTADNSVGEVRKIMANGANRICNKPLKAQQISDVINDYLVSTGTSL